MTFYQWDDAMSVGVSLIDDDHKALIHLINRLQESVDADDAYDVLSDILSRLIDYVDFHFAREEKVMRACGYPETDSHKEEHDRFTARIREIRTGFTPDTAQQKAAELTEFLKDWLNHHILVQDMAYRSHAEFHPDAARVAAAFGPGLLARMRGGDS